MSCKVGNQTNSQDPQAVNSRVFVGNLNTFQCSKTDVERIFQRYGRIAGISMHKGYAFIQFTNPFDARSACLGEDGRLIWGQTLDVNMVAEPKSHQTGRKRQNIAKTGNDWDYYYDSYYAQVGLPGPRLVPPMKRPRIHGPASSRPTLKAPSPNKSSLLVNNTAVNTNSLNASSASLNDLKTYSTPDILICGNCREHFTDVEQLIEHKKIYCKLRFTCKCHLLNGKGEEPAALLCSSCKDSFSSAWDLMVHVQAAHMLNIYQLSSDPSSGGSSRDQSETREFKHMNNLMGDGIPNGLNPNGTLMGDSLMEDSHCQTDLSSTTSSSSSTASSIAGGNSSLISPNNHHHHHHHLQLNHHQNQHHPYHHLHSDSSTMTADVSTSTGIDSITMSSSSSHQIISSGAPPGNNGNCMVVDNIIGGMGQPSSIVMGTATSAQTTPITNSVIMTDGHNPNNGGSQSLMNGNDGLMCSSSQCSTSVNHSLPNGTFITSQSPAGIQGMGQVHNNFITNNNNNNMTNSTSSSSSSISTSSYESSASMNVITSQPMEASTQTQCLQVDDSILQQNNNGPTATNAGSPLTNNNQVGLGATGNGTGIPNNFDDHCSIVSTLKQEANIHMPFSNGQVASI